MIKNFLNTLEDPERPLLGPNYKFLIKMGMLFPKNKLGRFFFYFLPHPVAVITAAATFELYCVRTDLNTVLNNLKFSTLGLVILAKVKIFIFGQERWRKIIEYVTEADKYERLTCDEIRGRIIEKYTKFGRLVTYIHVVMTGLTFIAITASPMLLYSSKTLRNNIRNGTAPFPHIVSMWTPFDKNQFPGIVILITYQTLGALWATGFMPACDSIILVTMLFFGGKLELLRERSKQMLGTDGKGISDEAANRITGELHDAHVLLMEHMKMLNTIVSPVMFTYVFVCSLMICASMFQVVNATTTFEKFILLQYLIFAIAQLFLFCWFSSELQRKNELVMLGPYECQWWAANARQRKNVMILAGQFSKVFIFTAGPFSNLSLELFVSVVKGAYSFYTLLRD